MKICDNHDPLDFSNACIRASWSAFLPATLVFLLCLGLLPMPRSLRRVFRVIETPFKSFLTLQEAAAIDSNPTGEFVPGDQVTEEENTKLVPTWRTVVFVFVGLAETLYWVADGAHGLYRSSANVWASVYSLLFAASWLYTVVRPIARPTVTAPYDTFTIYLLFFSAAILQCGGALYDHNVSGSPLPSTFSLFGMISNLLAVLVLLGVAMTIPRALPSGKIDPKEIGNTVSPEDYATLWQNFTFSWIYPLVRLGRDTTLHEKDVWDLSPTNQSRPLFTKFNNVYRSTLLRRILAANSQDLLMDFVFSLMSIAFNYAGPFFLKRILEAIEQENPTAKSRTNAYIYAFLAFVCSLLKAQADAQHLWFGRRGSVRLRTELMASIYDKALKRRDFSGIVDKAKDTNKDAPKGTEATPKGKGKGKAKSGKGKSDDPKAGADIGKIVNLMSSDANRMARLVSTIFIMYGAPFEIAFAGVFLYQLLGLSAFAGFLVLIVAWPLNNYLGRRTVRIHKALAAAMDKRMTVLSELTGAIKFIKFFAWEEKWISRALDVREAEISWIIKFRINQIFFNLVGNCAPILVSVLSFSVYIMNGHELTISTAFTAIALFGMVRAPLRVLPVWLVQIVQAGVSLDRIAVYLNEDEVTDQVSSLKKGTAGPGLSGAQDEGLGLEHATLKWNEVTETAKGTDKKIGTTRSEAPSNTILEVVSDSASERTVGENGERRTFELKDLSVNFPAGKLTLVTGPTASGKSALLMAVLGELTLLSGRIIMSKDPLRVDENGLMHSISYAAQVPWLRHQSIKENILFGYPYDEERYNQVVECCALKPDLNMLEDGDATEIGARGVNLSGGQKARVALARAVYARTKFVLLDDPLSAVDSHTSRLLFERLLCGPLLADRTVVLVTHHVELVLPGAYYVVRMLDGRIDTQGTVNDLRAQGVLEAIEHDATIQTHSQEKIVEEVAVLEEALDQSSKPADIKKPRKLIKDEHRETGGVKWSIYKTYLKASSYWIWGVLAFMVFINQFLGLGEKLWIRTWGDAYRNETSAAFYYSHSPVLLDSGEVQMNELYASSPSEQLGTHRTSLGSPTISGIFGIIWPDAAQHPFFYIGIYAGIGFAGAAVNALSIMAQYTGALRASRILFKRLLVSIVRATFRFHDTTPQGRILNRFGKDIDTIDSSLAGSLQSVNSSLAGFLAAIITVAVVFPYFVIPAFFIGMAYRELAIGYLNTGRDLRRMESTTRSPIYSHFGELLEGIVTVRAFSAERQFLDGLHSKLDVTTKMWYMFWMTNRWLLLNFDSLGAVIVLLTMIFSIATLEHDPGLAAVCITSAMAFTFSVYWTCRYWTSLELDLNSVERVIEYLDIPQEPPAVIESNRVPAYWPSSSKNENLLIVENLEVKYAPELPAVLNDISFALKGSERVGLLGRTGSGKSTLAMSIMRFVNPTQGRIIIDGIDISTIGVQDLRSRLTFIPQDATLFSGTLKDNLDPFGEHSDAECLDVLYRVHMVTDGQQTTGPGGQNSDSSNSSRPASIHTNSDSLSTTATNVDAKQALSLDTQVSAGGTNFSQGQRQLIAMARALLRRSSIIILDEATSSIDFATDAKIQTTIREEFNNSLLLTVAHRLRTVIDYDRLVILDNGTIAEFDSPWNLINKENGIFRNMCMKSGTFNELEAAAKEAASRG
ncbi:hypothetical protein GALMADRAFT_245072 [Galerina marginata CBS 339.88]|uniref:Multidrug resistance-associated ABC transporter n=1 Tax=Galerina marginata (strain CBS 339.88) TaxID=685588 RepID=A0A067TGI1_GALM3|nr:hypothetical protein GALMADRAFT_245072 [Galerina marginata CBS 339.88]